jgi:catechol 2,3-dioxygenase-like lactoylglutathione lyase family enzyme
VARAWNGDEGVPLVAHAERFERAARTSRKPLSVRFAGAMRFDLGDDRSMEPLPTSHLRIARPSRYLWASERFWVDGLGLEVLFRADASAEGGHALLMVGWPDAAWHLELVSDPGGGPPAAPTYEDLMVLYLNGEVDTGVVSRLVGAGGTQAAARNPYWDEGSVTIVDPDGYRLVLTSCSWP